MTVDEDNSVYVGNLSYNATEDSIRNAFNLYGQIVGVKMINERGGKCFCFVTYTNHRSAVDAIKDMDGRSIEGRAVRVNEVMTRGGRSNFGRRNNDRDAELDRGRARDRDKDYGRVRDRSHDQKRDWSRDRNQDKDRSFDRVRDIDPNRERFNDRGRGHDRDTDDERVRDRDQTDRDQEKEIRRSEIHHSSGNKYTDQTAKLSNGSDLSEPHSRERPSGSSHGDYDQVPKQLDVSHQKIEELQKEVYRMEELVEEKDDHVSMLREKAQKLEDALASAKKLTSNRRKQLVKLHNCFVNMKEYNEKLRSCEEELQSLVGSTMKELENTNGLDTDALLAS
ncbi:uncharacterized protein [Rutidosis leptorrhynchoides]|uniref:uncharacterized protein n=1 Tax=Rutidosis leptorrhynchoides TaxID=125765 RepID=UPI003A995DAF